MLMTLRYKPFTLRTFRDIPQLRALSKEELFEIEVVGHVFPFKTNSYVVEELINWNDVPNDPMFILTFPQKGMLMPHHYDEMASLIGREAGRDEIRKAANRIRMELNPHPAGQLEKNVPAINGERLPGIQHKYRETVLFFPSQGQTCHAYCTFCFRWPQFVGIEDLRFSSRDVEALIDYVSVHREVSDILFTGGDPLVMKGETLAYYIDRILDADLPHVKTIRLGTKALSYWPYTFLTDDDADIIIDAFKRVTNSGRHLAVMAHFNHPRELDTDAVQNAIWRIKETGAEIRTQTPLLRHINAAPRVLAELWERQVRLSCIPYYLFMVRDTGAQHYFGVPLVEAWEIFRDAYKSVSGIARTVRGPSMSAEPGKVQILGVEEVKGEKVIVLRMLQGRNPDWVQRPFFAEYDPYAIWLDDLRPAFGRERFFFEEDDLPLFFDEL
jgi:KamA family protein